MSFLDKAAKDLEKSGIEVGASAPPRYWFSTGNYVLNKILSGSFLRGIPQGRITCLTGPSGAGKSFLAANVMREAQRQDAIVVVLDSENALDDDFVSKAGVDTNNEGYAYYAVDTIPQAKKIISKIVRGYKDEYGDDPTAPKLLIVLDSLDMLMTETEADHFAKGVTKGDQGQRNKQLKAMLRELVQAVKRPNISMVVTAQVYKNQDVLNGEGVWMVSDAIKFSLSQIALLTKLKLRDSDREVQGIKLKAEGYKTRFTKPFQTVTLEVPYDEGMDPFNGLLKVAEELGVVTRKGAWYSYKDNKFQEKNITKEMLSNILGDCELKSKQFLQARLDDSELDTTTGPSSRSKRAEKAMGDE